MAIPGMQLNPQRPGKGNFVLDTLLEKGQLAHNILLIFIQFRPAYSFSLCDLRRFFPAQKSPAEPGHNIFILNRAFYCQITG